MAAGRVIQPRGSSTQPAADAARPEEAPPKLRKQLQRCAPPPRETPSRGVAEAEAQANARPSAGAAGSAAKKAAQLVAGMLLKYGQRKAEELWPDQRLGAARPPSATQKQAWYARVSVAVWGQLR